MKSSLEVPFVFWNKNSEKLKHQVTCLCQHKKILATGTETGEVCIWQNHKPKVICLVPYETECREIALVKRNCEYIGGVYIATLHGDNRVRLWDAQDGNCISVSEELPAGVTKVSASKRLLAVLFESSEVRVLDLWTMKEAAVLSTYSLPKGAFVSSKYIAVVDSDSQVYFWTLPEISELSEIKVDPEDCSRVALEGADPVSITYSDEAELWCVVFRHKVEFLHSSWIRMKEPNQAPISFLQSITSAEFVDEEVYLLLESHLVVYSLPEILSEIGTFPESSLNPHKAIYTLSTLAYQELSTPEYSVFCFGSESLVLCSQETLYEVNLKDKSQTSFSFELDLDSSDFADELVALEPGESICVSSIILGGDCPQYLLGTNKGSIFAMSFDGSWVKKYKYHTAPITYAYFCKGKLVSCCCDHKLCVWEEPEVPVQVITTWGSPIVKIAEVRKIQDTVTGIDETFWRDSWKNWEQTLLLQAQDGSMFLVSLVTHEIVCYFQALSSDIKSAEIHVLQEYLLVTCDDGYLYIFNMMSQALERVLYGEEAAPLLRKPFRTQEPQEYRKEDPFFPHKLIECNLRSQVNSVISSPLSLQSISVSGMKFSVLVVNVERLQSFLQTQKVNPSQLSYLFNLMQCRVKDCYEYKELSERLRGYLDTKELSVKGYPGTLGLMGNVSFCLPSKQLCLSQNLKTTLEVSYHSLLLEVMELYPELRVKAKFLVKKHICSSSHSQPSLTKLGLLVLSGNKCAAQLLKHTLSDYQTNYLQKLSGFFRGLILKHLDSKVCLTEVLSTVILAYIEITLQNPDSQLALTIIGSLRNIIQSSDYSSFAASVLGKTVNHLKNTLPNHVIVETQQELFNHSHIETKALRRALANVAVCDIEHFIEYLSTHITNKNYSRQCLGSLEELAKLKYSRLTEFLPSLVELILKTLDPHNSALRKHNITKASEALQEFVLKLPMVSFTQAKQQLAVGTSDNLILVYDLKTATRWKVLRGHTAPVSVLAFDESGKNLASYSVSDCSLRVWKLGSGFLGGLMSGEVRPSKLIYLDRIDAVSPKFSDILDILSLAWSEDNDSVTLVRENGNDYVYIFK